ncbi:hypothetical protein [Telmatospirillum sp. J64-1]|uniref:hypothetical protein n=1 Tax=Telmatospirillum sp. J64-1 TaxID=2502183 RepID=UPI00115DFBFB|nr:hypothetical protein [Telmatospirillum sp. J64-1]
MRIASLSALLLLLAAPALAGEAALLDQGRLADPPMLLSGTPPELLLGGGAIAIQAGSGNGVSQSQKGAFNRAAAHQLGLGNQSTVTQQGTANSAETLQLGNGNTVIANQNGAYNENHILQTGAQYTVVYQAGALNRLTPDQVPQQPALILQKGVNAPPVVLPLQKR